MKSSILISRELTAPGASLVDGPPAVLRDQVWSRLFGLFTRDQVGHGRCLPLLRRRARDGRARGLRGRADRRLDLSGARTDRRSDAATVGRHGRAGIELIEDELSDVELILIDDRLVDALEDAGAIFRLHLIAGEPQDETDAVTLGERGDGIFDFAIDTVVDTGFLFEEFAFLGLDADLEVGFEVGQLFVGLFEFVG